jgi:hypothetical protein
MTMIRRSVTWFAGLAVGALALATACSAPRDDEAGAEGSAAISADDPTTPTASARCTGEYVINPEDDARQRRQEFDLTLDPGSAFEIWSYTTAETFTVTVASPDGKSRHVTSSLKDEHGALLSNSWSQPKKYRVTLERASDANAYIFTFCYPLVDAPKLSGPDDNAVCKEGKPCRRSADGGVRDATCSSGINVNLGDDYDTGTCS